MSVSQAIFQYAPNHTRHSSCLGAVALASDRLRFGQWRKNFFASSPARLRTSNWRESGHVPSLFCSSYGLTNLVFASVLRRNRSVAGTSPPTRMSSFSFLSRFALTVLGRVTPLSRIITSQSPHETYRTRIYIIFLPARCVSYF